CAIGHTSGRLF
nr:immunoglobulin light chain junction region [Macaca mulatta]MPN65239.1 immunoglobulin light chain junction region [Macaca mulatta]MPN65299.1 immunoglobulin light chain junction region [Macaca mulatta]MPN65310.1 immunoglobulin light chain junction region [Macaca mulatta]MPN65320.1 immunoglobulin light chain junction region [Macaca mulatta]